MTVQNDIAEGVIVIADLARGDWPSRARRSLIELFSAKEEETCDCQGLKEGKKASGEKLPALFLVATRRVRACTHNR